MPEDVPVAPYHDPHYTDWIWEQEKQRLYPEFLPVSHYLGSADGCRWTGPGFYYDPWKNGLLSLRMKVVDEAAMRDAGNRLPRVRTGLYRFFDEAGELLYVGISGDPELRRTQHSKDKSWWPDVMDSTVEWFNNRDVALDREAAAIRREGPKYNVQHNRLAA